MEFRVVLCESEVVYLNQESEKLAEMIQVSGNIVFFGGAGVSTESGIPDFRSAEGIYQQSYRYAPEQVVSHSFFMQHPDVFYDFYKEKMMFLEAKPNPAHRALAQLEEKGKLKAVVTQNIDGLHQWAGSKNVLELHGSIHRNFCMSCGKSYDAAYVKKASGIPKCSCGGRIKPDVVLYEEGLNPAMIRKSVSAIADADMLIIGGTSLIVYPAAGFVDYFKGRFLVIINKGETAKALKADLVIDNAIGKVFDEIPIS